MTTMTSLAGISQGPAASNAASASPTTTGGKNTLDYNAFLQLLMAQMRNQDPTAPTSSTEFVSQLASFSSVQQQTQTNTLLGQVLLNSNLAQAGSLVGLRLQSADGSTDGIVVSASVTSSGITASLDNGQSVLIGNNITVSKA
jgi:flagellar basal-body rod modification protein FlgD